MQKNFATTSQTKEANTEVCKIFPAKQKKFLGICIIFMKRDHKIKPAKLEIRPSVTKFYHHGSVGDICSENQKYLLLKPVFLFLRNNTSTGKG